MQISSFNIQNFKSLENISVENCSSFHALIGANSAGKTSIFDALNLIKLIGKEYPNPQLITKGLSEFETKSLVITLHIDLDDDERRNYLLHSFNIVESRTDELLKTNALRQIIVQITILFFGEKVGTKNYQYSVFVSQLEISGENNTVAIINSNGDDLQFKGKFAPNNSLARLTLEDYVSGVGMTGIKINTTNYMHPTLFSSRFLTDLINNMRYVEAIRETNKKISSSFFDQESSIGQRGEHLANFMDTLWTNNNSKYLDIEKYCKAIFPNIETIRPRKLPDNNIVLELKKKNLDNPITLDADGRGLDQALVVIWRVATSPEKTIWFIDEPEIHLHPGAQKLLFEFFQSEISKNKQIFVSTHSMVFIHRCIESQISILLYKDGITELSSLENLVHVETTDEIDQEQARSIVYDALGYDSSQSLEYTTIVAVEGKTDEKIFKQFAKTLGKPIDSKMVKFIPVGNKNDAKKFSPILKYTVSKRTIIILDNDNQNPSEIKQSIQSLESEYKKKIGLEKSLLTNDEFCFYDKDAYSIESYLLDAEAIGKIGGFDETKIEEIKQRILSDQVKIKQERQKPKVLLSDIWSDFGLGSYDDKSPETIAKNMSKISLLKFPVISEIIDKINGVYQNQ